MLIQSPLVTKKKKITPELVSAFSIFYWTSYFVGFSGTCSRDIKHFPNWNFNLDDHSWNYMAHIMIDRYMTNCLHKMLTCHRCSGVVEESNPSFWIKVFVPGLNCSRGSVNEDIVSDLCDTTYNSKKIIFSCLKLYSTSTKHMKP